MILRKPGTGGLGHAHAAPTTPREPELRDSFVPVTNSALNRVWAGEVYFSDITDLLASSPPGHRLAGMGMLCALSFNRYGRLYYLDPGEFRPEVGDRVLIPTDDGPE